MLATRDQGKSAEWLAPLRHFGGNGRAGIAGLRFVEPDALPGIARRLLAHDRDMTPTLRNHHREALGLEVLAAEREGNVLLRKVLLRGRNTGRVVEFGAIRIDLSLLPARVRERVEAGRDPLGAILEEEEIPHRSQPRGFLEAQAGPELCALMEAEPGQTVYGRCNQLALETGAVFAEIVELLPPPRESQSSGAEDGA